MGAGVSTAKLPSEGRQREERLPPLHKKPPVSQMDQGDLKKAAEDIACRVMTPCELPSPDTQLDKRNLYDLRSPEMDNAPTRSRVPGLPPVLPSFTSKGYGGQTSLFTTAQRQNRLSDNSSLRSSFVLDDEWNPREFGPLMESVYLTGLDSSLQYRQEEDDDAVGFYLHFLHLNGAMSVQQPRTISVNELIAHSSTAAAAAASKSERTRFLMGSGATPPLGDASRRSPRLAEAKQQMQRKSRYAAARELGRVDPDRYLDSLYQHARERERTHFFVDPDGEICRLYHTEGWHLLGSAKRRAALHQRQRSGSGDSMSRHHRGHRSRRGSNGSNGSFHRSSGSALGRPATASRVGGEHSSVTAAFMVHPTPPAKPTSPSARGGNGGGGGGVTLRIRGTRLGSSGMLSGVAHSSQPTPTPPPQQQQQQPQHLPSKSQTGSGGKCSHGSDAPQKSTSLPEPKGVDTQKCVSPSGEVSFTESVASASLGSGCASTLPGSCSGGLRSDFFSQAFCGGGDGRSAAANGARSGNNDVVAGRTPSSLAQLHLAPILVRTEGDHFNSTSRRGSFGSFRREGGDSAGYPGDSTTPRRRLSTRRVSFSQGTRYFKKEPFYLTSCSGKTSDYIDPTPPEVALAAPSLQVPQAAAASSAVVEAAPSVPAPSRPETSTSYAQLTLLKDKMNQNRQRTCFEYNEKQQAPLSYTFY